MADAPRALRWAHIPTVLLEASAMVLQDTLDELARVREELERARESSRTWNARFEEADAELDRLRKRAARRGAAGGQDG